MMPCVAKESSEVSPSAVRSADRPKNIYKPKYHAFSIDSLVGNNDKKDADRESTAEGTNNFVQKPTATTSPSPSGHRPTTATPPLDDQKTVNGNSNNTDLRSYEYSDDGNDTNENSSRLLAKDEGILRSYMTTPNQSAGPQTDPHLNASHQNSHYISNLTHNSDQSILNQPLSHRFVDSIQNSNPNPKYDHILSLRSNLTDSRNGSPERAPFGSPALQTSPFNSSQYYCNQLYCRPFDDRLVQSSHHFLPQVCDYKLISSKSPDICCQSSYSPYRKPKRIRTAFSPGQLLRLEEIFERNRYVVGCERKQLARDLNLSETQIKVWFQNRRTKHKREKHQQMGHKRSSTVSHMMASGSTLMSINSGNSSDDDYDHKY